MTPIKNLRFYHFFLHPLPVHPHFFSCIQKVQRVNSKSIFTSNFSAILWWLVLQLCSPRLLISPQKLRPFLFGPEDAPSSPSIIIFISHLPSITQFGTPAVQAWGPSPRLWESHFSLPACLSDVWWFQMAQYCSFSPAMGFLRPQVWY